ncbi:hypothetical protein MOV66_03175 [Agrobacterium sp. SHOUNA12C]|jgi:hypothetical protein|uniref:Uncharacterized protein n=2 Tax=Rhizobium rhizogenes TaxID=359 RepID=B9JJR8_RHIR8|nr:hypothetical protein [Rhizobium rhizogenes]ACM30160.1 conserved hypothetical protein [Rhizobium rhizogenes K84]KAA6482940.1 hypothetical protein DXT98_25230 [Agrobacterium sp. ICMP 7243]MCJ9719516.1 hypothetical protein [Agrobacterium sp. BETTINA12B]MCJ9755634.1 hypothetical protein [Agrobacterium sp. SHOUNA12C]OCJ02025.1 hypothetical protein A6U85_10315 [Agrobacterium sp. 13-626]OCJ10633.1 hypothetical protein A6U88_20155 [Agrobacterium sp. B131/95]OCJ15476.1 hypothetical protein A6U89_1
MSTLLTINVVNNQAVNNSFFFFQQPAVYTGGATVYSNSLFSQLLAPSSSGSSLTFQSNVQYYAGVQQTNNAVPIPGQLNGFASAIQPIDLTPINGSANNSTIMAPVPLSLTPASPTSGVQQGAFRIATGLYQPPAQQFYAGSAVKANGQVILSNFVLAQPQQNIDCQPVLKFYVGTGTYTAGVNMNFTQSSGQSALCDFTGGYSVANVAYNSDGSWTVTMS